MWFSASTKHFVGMNRFGKLEKIIDLGDRFILHHDYALDDDGNIVSLATDLTRYDHAVQDQVIKVNTSTGKVTKLVDFGEMFPDYKASTDHSGIDESDPAASGRWDWIHFNTIQLLPDGQYYIYMFDNDFGYAMTRPTTTGPPSPTSARPSPPRTRAPARSTAGTSTISRASISPDAKTIARRP